VCHRYLYQRSDGAIYSTTEEYNKLVRVEIPAGYVEVCSLLKAIERSLRRRSRRPFVSAEIHRNTTPRTNIPVTLPTGMLSTSPVEELPPPLSEASGPVPGEIVNWPSAPSPGPDSFTEDFHEDVFSDLSHSTDSETQKRPGTSEAVLYKNPWHSEYPMNPDYDDNVSVTSSNEGSVFSISSLASSATDLSKGSGYSAVQIATATRELLSIFRDDSVLQPLYAKAIHGAIGPRKFVNVFRRLLKAFADRLKDEAQDRLDFLAARLVALKAREISEAILEKYQLGKAPDLDVPEERESAFTLPDDSSDEDEHEETNVDETIFEELTNVREFLIQSAAFRLLRTDLQHFVSSKRQSKKPSSERDNKTYLEEQVNQIYKSITPRISAHGRSTQSAFETDCSDSIRYDRALLELHLHALDILGEDQFVIKYADLLRHHISNSNPTVDNKADDSMNVDIDDHLITTASAILLHLEIADANASCWKDQSFDTKPNMSFFVDLHSKVGEDLESLTPLDLISRELALSTLRRPLHQLLSQIPKGGMELSSRNDMSLVNTIKAFIEDRTMVEWDWWPLASRIPDVAPGECRLQWKVRFRNFVRAWARPLNHTVWRNSFV